jgi:hypothetical protein
LRVKPCCFGFPFVPSFPVPSGSAFSLRGREVEGFFFSASFFRGWTGLSIVCGTGSFPPDDTDRKPKLIPSLIQKNSPLGFDNFLAICEGCRLAGIGWIGSRLAVPILLLLFASSNGGPNTCGGSRAWIEADSTEEKYSRDSIRKDLHIPSERDTRPLPSRPLTLVIEWRRLCSGEG